MTEQQRALCAAHGTLQEFADAVWRAYVDGFLDSVEQGQRVIATYRMEWEEAGKE